MGFCCVWVLRIFGINMVMFYSRSFCNVRIQQLRVYLHPLKDFRRSTCVHFFSMPYLCIFKVQMCVSVAAVCKSERGLFLAQCIVSKT